MKLEEYVFGYLISIKIIAHCILQIISLTSNPLARLQELLGLDVMHKFMWVRLIARMFEAMAGNFAYSGDIHLFLNVLNGAVILHSEDSCILRYVVATYINAAHNFKNIFSTNGYLLIMPTLLQLYSTHQTNKLVTTTVEYAVKQFYLMNRKPFILQMFGSVSTILDTNEMSVHGEAHKVCFFFIDKQKRYSNKCFLKTMSDLLRFLPRVCLICY